MAFDKNAYNRMYYQRNKELWEKYRDSRGGRRTPGVHHRETTYTTARGIGEYADPNYAANRVGPSRPRTISPGTANMASRKEIERKQRTDRYGQMAKGAAKQAEIKDWQKSFFSEGLADWRKFQTDRNMDRINSAWMKNRNLGAYKPKKTKKKNILQRAASYVYNDAKEIGKNVRSSAKRGTLLKDAGAGVKRATKSYASNWKTGAKSIKSGVKSYGSAWKTGAKSIAGGAKSAAKSAAKKTKKFFSKLGW